jgi:pyruvate dehydrogenase (quinone)
MSRSTWEQFNATSAALLAGDEDRTGFVKMGLKTKVQEFLPHKTSGGST